MLYTLEYARTQLTKWEALQEKAADSQSSGFDVGGMRRQKNRAELDKISVQVDFWRAQVASLIQGGIRVRRGVPV